MSDADLPRCRSCFAVLRFIEMGSGKRMPCNPVADRTGNVAARKTPRGYVDGVVLHKGETAPEGFTVFRPHWADCDMRPRNAKPAAPSGSLF